MHRCPLPPFFPSSPLFLSSPSFPFLFLSALLSHSLVPFPWHSFFLTSPPPPLITQFFLSLCFLSVSPEYLLLSELFPLFSARQAWSIRPHTDSHRVILVRLIIITISWISLTLNTLTTHFILRVHMLQDSNARDTQSTYMSPQHYKSRSEEAGRIKGLIRPTDSQDQPIDRPRRHPVTIAIIGTL